MKKVLAIAVMFIVLVGGLAGCGGKDTTKASPGTGTGTGAGK